MSHAPGGDGDEAVEQSAPTIERMMRRAAELGLDPERVARALDHRMPEPAPIVYQAVAEVRTPSWFTRTVARRFARPS